MSERVHPKNHGLVLAVREDQQEPVSDGATEPEIVDMIEDSRSVRAITQGSLPSRTAGNKLHAPSKETRPRFQTPIRAEAAMRLGITVTKEEYDA